MSKCFSCGGSFGEDTNAMLRKYKDQFDKLGISRYYYKLNASANVMVCQANSFNFIFENEIKPNLQDGAEFAHISEYR